MKRISHRLLGILSIILCVFLFVHPISLANSPQPKAKNAKNDERLWNLNNVDIKVFINEVAYETGKNFIVAPQVTGKVTFISSYPLTSEELYQAFLALLEVSGFVAVPSGPITKILPNDSIKEQGTPYFANKTPGSAMTVTIARVKYVSATELVKVLKQLIFHFGYIEVYSPTNDIIISDYASNIQRILQLIHHLDKPSASSVEVIHLYSAPASEMVKMLTPLLQAKGGSNLMLAADERGNNILLHGGTPEQQMQVRSLINQLDSPLKKRNTVTEVIHLKFLRAEKTAVILSSLIENYKQEKTAPGQIAKPTQTTPNLAETLALTNYPTVTSGASIQNNAQSMTDSNRTVADFTNMTQRQPRSGSTSPSVQWEEATNSVIVTVPADLLGELRAVVKKLDVRQPQILIEAIIAEVETDRAKELGVEINTGGAVKFLTRFPITLPLSDITSTDKLSVAQGLSLAYSRNGDIRFLLRALQEDNRSNILSTPNLVTLDNEPAQIKVGQKISFSIGQIQNNPTGGNPFNYFNQEDVGLILTINPQVTSNGAIKLIIEQELSNILPGQVSAGENPNLSQRFIHTTVMANSGDLLVLGGLIQDDWEETVSKVPLLGDIPVAGVLFRSHQKQLVKRNLMIFLKPTILHNDKTQACIVNCKYQQLQEAEFATATNIPTEDIIVPSVLPASINNRGEK